MLRWSMYTWIDVESICDKWFVLRDTVTETHSCVAALAVIRVIFFAGRRGRYWSEPPAQVLYYCCVRSGN